MASAVKDGVITQAQADAILADTKPGAFGFGDMEHGGKGDGGFDGALAGLAGTVGAADAAVPIRVRMAPHSRAPSRRDDPFRNEALT